LDHPANTDRIAKSRRAVRAALLLVVALLGLAGLRHGAAAAPLSREGFTQEFAKAYEVDQPGTKLRILGPLWLQIVDATGGVATVHLENAYMELRLDPAGFGEIIRRHVAAYASAGSERHSIDRSHIVPIVKSRRWITDYAAIVKERGLGDEAVAVHDELNTELVVVYAEDLEKTYRYLLPGDLKRLGLGGDDLSLLARENLSRLVPAPQVIAGPFASGIRVDGNYEASLLLYPEWWEDAPIKVDGDYVVAVPARDLLLVTGSNNQAGIAQIRELARQSVQKYSHAIVDTLFVFRDGRFTRFE
jgi:uncharacterized protein YtpQ (UPF0354 family)